MALFGDRRASLAVKTRRAFPHHTKADHERLAHTFAEHAGRFKREYGRVLRAAIKRYGDVKGTYTSGIYNPAFPERVKNRLRSLLREADEATAKSIAHWEASGRRKPWRDSPLKKIAYPGDGLYGSLRRGARNSRGRFTRAR
jgi:hypothetical protein